MDKKNMVKPLSQNERVVAYALPVLFGVFIFSAGTGYVYASQKNKAYLESMNRTKERLLIETTMQLQEVLKSSEDSKMMKALASIDTNSHDCMMKTLFYEAGSYNNKDGSIDKDEIKKDMFLIASSIINRTKTRALSVCGVVREKSQYSWYWEPKKYPPQIAIMKKNAPEKLKLAQEITEELLSGKKKPIRFIEYYHNPKLSKDNWHLDRVKDGTFVPFLSLGENSNEKHTYYMETKYIKQLRVELKKVLNDDYT